MCRVCSFHNSKNKSGKIPTRIRRRKKKFTLEPLADIEYWYMSQDEVEDTIYSVYSQQCKGTRIDVVGKIAGDYVDD